MANPADIIKSYLVSIGFSVDSVTHEKFKDSINKLDSLVQSKVGGMAATYAKAATVMVSALGSVAIATGTLLGKIAEADMASQKFALRMYMNVEAAKQLRIVTNAMGESLHDIAWMPEKNEEYRRLMAQAKKMEPPSDAAAQNRYIRSVKEEFIRLKVETIYGLQNIGYYLFKYLQGPITASKIGLQKFNDFLTATMPIWTKKIAEGLTIVYNIGASVLRLLGDLGEGLAKLWSRFDKTGQMLLVLGGIFTAIFIAGPIGRALIVLSGLVVLIEDFYGYVDGRKSSKKLAPIWDMLLNALYEVRRGIKAVEFTFDDLVESKGFKLFQSVVNAFFGSPYKTKEGDATSIARLHERRMPEGARKRFEKWLKEEGTEFDLEREKARWGRPTVGAAGGPVIDSMKASAQRISERTGVPAPVIFGHLYHETGGGTNRGARELNNFAGINFPGSTTGTDYVKFPTLERFENSYINIIKKNPGALAAKSPEEYAKALREKGYYTGPLADAQKGYSYGATKWGEGASAQSAVTQNNNVAIEVKGGVTEALIEDLKKTFGQHGFKDFDIHGMIQGRAAGGTP